MAKKVIATAPVIEKLCLKYIKTLLYRLIVTKGTVIV